MVTYRRARLAGGTYFFTVTLLDRSSHVLVDNIDVVGAAFRSVRATRPFTTLAAVVLPDHLHVVWQLPEGDDDFATRWRLFKSQATTQLAARGINIGQRTRGERDLWQRRYWEHVIRDERDLAAHVDYIHYNPVKHGSAAKAVDWPHSSFHGFVARGIVSANWAASAITAPVRE